MWKKILAGLVVIVLILVIIVAMQPAAFRISRSTTIAAPAEEIFTEVNDFHNWDKWSPWAKLDPAMKQSYEGAPAGTGAIYNWAGNDEVGEGKMTITDSHSNDLIGIKLEFLKPFAMTNNAEFTFQPEEGKTVVTWTMVGKNGFLAKGFNLVMNMDKLVGADFEKGLAQLKTVSESKPKQESKQDEAKQDESKTGETKQDETKAAAPTP